MISPTRKLGRPAGGFEPVFGKQRPPDQTIDVPATPASLMPTIANTKLRVSTGANVQKEDTLAAPPVVLEL